MLPGDKVRYFNKTGRYQGPAIVVAVHSTTSEVTIRITTPINITTKRLGVDLVELLSKKVSQKKVAKKVAC